jgi:hypothetical protein
LIIKATNAFLDGDLDTGKTLLRDYLNATEALPSIARELAQDEKSIRRMIGPKGNPTLKNFVKRVSPPGAETTGWKALVRGHVKPDRFVFKALKQGNEAGPDASGARRPPRI